MDKSSSIPPGSHYHANYGNFQTELYAEIRREAFGEDIGQNSWLTADEQDRFLAWLELGPGTKLLDVACGAGGPALRITGVTGCSLVGTDLHEAAIATAKALATQRGLAERAEFRVADAALPLPSSEETFDAITCIDAINHFPDRPSVVANWVRMLKPGGRLLFTDPITVTGPLASVEIAIRSSAGSYLFVPHGYDEGIVVESGLKLLACEDVTANMSKVAEARLAARASRRAALVEIEGEQGYENQQRFLTVAACIARERRLSRFVYLAEKLK